MFTQDKEDKDVPFVRKPNWTQPLRRDQVKQRTSEVLDTIKELRDMSPELHFEIFGVSALNAKLDMSRYVLAGHSYGATTMISTSS